jgi:hypothetical protein
VDQYYDASGKLPPHPGADALPVADHMTKSSPLPCLFPREYSQGYRRKKRKNIQINFILIPG